MKKVSIVGFGRFGQTLYRLIRDDFAITIYDKKRINTTDLTKNTTVTNNVRKIYNSEVIFYAVPINAFEDVIAAHKKYFQKYHILIDVLSVKMYPAKVFKKYLTDTNVQALLTHPMFGPDSSKNGFAGLPIILDRFMTSCEIYKFWKEYFKDKKLNVIEMSAQNHDRIAANSQGITHFIGRLLNAYHLKQTPISSLGTKKLLEVVEQTCNDTWQLFTDLQHYNPYTKQMRIRFGEIYDKLYNKLLPKQVSSKLITVGIQGGRGSFNEEALQHYIKEQNITRYKIKYLYTSENVLKALYKGDIDKGQFAIHNSVGGIVGESIYAMANYKFKIIEEFTIKISHTLMIKKDAKISEITTIMTHPQGLAQCKDTLSKKYPHLKLISGENELMDQSMVAKYLSQNKLPKNIATLGSKILGKIYGLQIIEDNLQDAEENSTGFLVVARI
ncbi:MAG: prephenate dehydrogenase/arogenate dehydrogenase family protein [Candidatus Daviesbacteria bacterium]|nr:prephenate dehydrogenase/arogenate dehydrogenase family protein [Candidatus Daviesbacteria bacterium]